jgi:hypothetical protein
MRRLLTQEDSEDTKGVVRRRNLKERQLKSANIFNLVEKTLEKAIYIAMLNFPCVVKINEWTLICIVGSLKIPKGVIRSRKSKNRQHNGEKFQNTKGGNQKP